MNTYIAKGSKSSIQPLQIKPKPLKNAQTQEIMILQVIMSKSSKFGKVDVIIKEMLLNSFSLALCLVTYMSQLYIIGILVCNVCLKFLL